jgi:hypothetical protein
MVMMLLPTILLEFSLGALAPPSHIAKNLFYFSSTTSIPFSTASADFDIHPWWLDKRATAKSRFKSSRQDVEDSQDVARRLLRMSCGRPTTRSSFFHDHRRRIKESWLASKMMHTM